MCSGGAEVVQSRFKGAKVQEGAEVVQRWWCMDQSRNIAGGAEVVVHGSE